MALLEEKDRAWRVARSRAHGTLDPEDLVQEAWVRILEMDHVDLERIGSLVSTVISNLAADEFRRDTRRRRAMPRLILTSEQVGAFEDAVCERAWGTWLNDQTTRLSRRDAEVLRLRVDAVPNRGIAERLGMSVKAVESALDRARRQMRAIAKAAAGALAILIAPRERHGREAATLGVLTVASSAFAFIALPHSTPIEAPPAIAVHVTHDRLAEGVPGAGPYLAAGERSTSESRPSSTGVVFTGRDTPSVATVPGVATPLVQVGPSSVDREHEEETFLDTVQRCLEEGLIVEPTHVECRERPASVG